MKISVFLINITRNKCKHTLEHPDYSTKFRKLFHCYCKFIHIKKNSLVNENVSKYIYLKKSKFFANQAKHTCETQCERKWQKHMIVMNMMNKNKGISFMNQNTK